MAEEKAHAELGASNSEIWINCPGAPTLWREAPEKPESPYAVEGTKAHDLGEKWLTHYRDKTGAFIFPKNTPEDMKAAVGWWISEVKKAWTPGSHKDLVIEDTVYLRCVDPSGSMFGRIDTGIVEHFGTLESIDYKHGRGVKVEVYKETALGVKLLNTQLVYYALALAEKYDFNFRDVILKIIQPRCEQGQKISAVRVSMKELTSYIDLFKRAVERTQSKYAKRQAGPWCRFCKAKPICKEGQGKFRSDSRSDFEEL